MVTIYELVAASVAMVLGIYVFFLIFFFYRSVRVIVILIIVVGGSSSFSLFNNMHAHAYNDVCQVTLTTPAPPYPPPAHFNGRYDKLL